MTTLASGRPDSTSDLVPRPEFREAPEPTIRRRDPNPRAARVRRHRVAYAAAALVIALIVALGVMAVWGGVDWRGFGQELTGASDPIVDAAEVPAPAAGTPGPPAAIGQGRVLVSARPWAEITSVLDADGQIVEGLAAPLYTPALLALPTGRYRLELRHPDTEAPEFLDVQVPIVGTQRVSVDFGAVGVDAFFSALGLTEALEGAGAG